MYECIGCHKIKDVTKMILRPGFTYCQDCNEPEEDINKGNTITLSHNPNNISSHNSKNENVITIIPKLLLPSPEIFNQFMDDVLFFKCDVLPVLNEHILTLTAAKTKKSISLNIDALLQVLCDKLEHPAVEPSTAYNIPINLLNQIHDSYADIQDKIDHAFLRYNKIIMFDDPRIKEFAEYHHQIKTIPLMFKLQYQEWEKTLISGKIAREVQKGLDENNKQLTQVQQDYAKKQHDLEVNTRTEIDKYKRKVHELTTNMDRVASLLSTSKNKCDSMELEKTELYEKYKELEKSLSSRDVELSKQKFEIEKLKKEAEKHKTEDKWEFDTTSEEDRPRYYNTATKTIIKYPPKFDIDFELDHIDDDILFYKQKNGDEQFKLPQSLSIFVKNIEKEEDGEEEVSKSQPNTNSGSGKPNKDEFSKDQIKILQTAPIKREDAVNLKELARISDVEYARISKPVNGLIEMGKIIKLHEDKQKKYYKL